MGGGSTTTVKPPKPTAAELELQGINLDLANQQLTSMQQQSEFQSQLFDLIGPQIQQAAQDQAIINSLQTPEERRAHLENQFNNQQRREEIEGLLMEEQLASIQRGGAASPEQEALINRQFDAALEGGQQQISAFAQDNLELLRNELAPSLGLRPTDSPIIDRGGLIAREAIRQQGQLSSNLGSARANALLNFPLHAQSVMGAANQSQQQLLQSGTQFQQQLRQNAQQNRLNLTSSSGLGLATAFDSGAALRGFQSFRANTASRSTSKSLGFGDVMGGLTGLASIGSGIGGLSQGIDTLF